ncbi:MAG: hypothetical protein P1U53_03395 [Sulfitobacter sp.]|nr:hypothetical protein [Sulfitobacter sp.]
MSWLRTKLFGSRKSRDQELAENMYSALVLDGGPSGEAPDHIEATQLEIPFGKLERFALKRLISLEAMLFVASQIETAERSEKLQAVFGDGQLHPFALEMRRLVATRWRERGIEISDSDVVDRCFDEVEEFLEKPFRWGRKWLDEFYDDPETSGEHYILWTQQWLKEFDVMRTMAKEYA